MARELKSILYTDEYDWREELLRRLKYLLYIIMGFAAILATVAARSRGMQLAGVNMFVTLLVLIAILSRNSVPYAWRAWAAILSIFYLSAVSYFLAGFNAGSALGAAFCVVLAVLLLGARAMTAVVVAFILLTVLLTFAISTGVWQGPSPLEANQADTVIWLRTSMISSVLWCSIALSVVFVVNTMERNLARREQALAEKDSALEQLRVNEAQRRRAERAQREAELVAHQAQKLEAVGQLAAGVAHDFNNTLMVIQGWNQIRGSEGSNEDHARATEAIEQATQQAEQLARQLLTFARKEERAPKYLSLERLVNETAATLRRLLPPAIEMRVDTRPVAAVYADETHLQQLIFNLIINARDALPDGGNITVCVRAATAEEASLIADKIEHRGDWVVLEIKDDGQGMDEALQRRIFEPFFTTKDVGEGSGLGLSTSLGIVQQSGGHLALWSQPGKGSCFRVSLPAAELADGIEPEQPASGASVLPRGARVLT